MAKQATQPQTAMEPLTTIVRNKIGLRIMNPTQPPELPTYNYYGIVPLNGDEPDDYDGDTLNLVVDLGRDVWQGPEYHRLYGIQAPEIWPLATRAEATLAREFLKQALWDHSIVHPGALHISGPILLVRTHKNQRRSDYRPRGLRGKFGRWLVELFGEGDDGDWINLNALMLQSGHAEVYDE